MIASKATSTESPLPSRTLSPAVHAGRDSKRNHDSQRRGRILRILLRPEIGHFSPLKNTEHLEKRENIHGRKFKKSNGAYSPRLQVSVACRGRTCPDHESFVKALANQRGVDAQPAVVTLKEKNASAASKQATGWPTSRCRCDHDDF